MPAPFTLVLETATPHASLGLAGPGAVFKGLGFQSDRHHNALLFGPLGQLLAGLAPSMIGRVLVGSGPGSYSGTRVGIAAAQGVALAAACEAVAIPSLLAVPAVSGASDGVECLFLGDARRGAFWTARTCGGNMVAAPALTDVAGLHGQLEAAAAAGTAVVTLEHPERFGLPGELAALVLQQIPTAEALWLAWQRADAETRATWTAAPPQPIYLKPPHITVPKRSWLVPS